MLQRVSLLVRSYALTILSSRDIRSSWTTSRILSVG
nr:MAG TPA: hypothetical protein [Caudoviricetes sp.]